MHWNHAKFSIAVQEVYDSMLSNDHELRDIIKKIMKKHVSSVLINNNFKNLLISKIRELNIAILQDVLNLVKK